MILIGALTVWFLGTRLVIYVDAIADKLHLGKAFLGALLLGGITSLPELATTVSASYLGNGPLAAANLLGGVSMQTVVMAVADLILLKKALTYVSPKPVLIMGGVLLIIQLAFVVVCITLGEFFSFSGIGLWSVLNFALFLFFLFVIKKYEGEERWVAVDLPEEPESTLEKKKVPELTSRQLWLRIFLCSILVVGGGTLISFSANQLVSLTGMSSTFMGASIVAITTSLPEVTTTFYAIRLGAYSMAISNIFGSNSMMIGFLFISDIFYRKGLIIDSLDNSTLFICGIGIIVTAAYLWGLLERRDKTILRMGIDSVIVILIQAFALFILYFLF